MNLRSGRMVGQSLWVELWLLSLVSPTTGTQAPHFPYHTLLLVISAGLCLFLSVQWIPIRLLKSSPHGLSLQGSSLEGPTTPSTGLPHHFAKPWGHLAHTAYDRCVCVCVCAHHRPETVSFGGDRDGFWESSLYPQQLGQLVPMVFLGWGSSAWSTHGKVRIRVSFRFGYCLLTIFDDWGMLQGTGGTTGSRRALVSF